MEIVEFLNARLDEDGPFGESPLCCCADKNGPHDPDCPFRLAREVEAKRRIIDAAEEATVIDASLDLDRRVGERDDVKEPFIGDVILRALALPYDSHPDYREEWKP